MQIVNILFNPRNLLKCSILIVLISERNMDSSFAGFSTLVARYFITCSKSESIREKEHKISPWNMKHEGWGSILHVTWHIRGWQKLIVVRLSSEFVNHKILVN